MGFEFLENYDRVFGEKLMPEKETSVYVTGLALINNYICTNQIDKVNSTTEAITNFGVEPHPAWEFFRKNEPCNVFGKNWNMENLDGKSIEIFCDHGMGDTVQMFRYIKKLKIKYNVKIVLNSLQSQPLQRLCDQLSFIDVFSKHHVKCDYHTNIMQLPEFYHGRRAWRDIVNSEISIPQQPMLEALTRTTCEGKKFGFGLKFKSATGTELFQKKSIRPKDFEIDCWNWASLEPDATWTDTVELGDVADLVSVMATLPTIVSVDTLTLHVAGSMGIPTIGLLCADADARWGKGTKTPWYPSVTLIRQEKRGEGWGRVLQTLEKQLRGD
jgi:hypothetical protein